MYALAGTVSIPEERKEEFAEIVLEVLYRGGIRKTESILLNGTPLTVVRKVQADRSGIASFDYSIFEKIKRSTATFDVRTGELHVSDSGFCEYCMIMNTIMVLQQVYSDTPCFLTKDEKQVNVYGYLRLLRTMLVEKTSCESGKHMREKPEEPFPLYIPMQRDSEDEFLEMWNRSNLKMSDRLLEQIVKWKEEFARIDSVPEMDMEQELCGILSEMETIWHCRYADRSFVDEFLLHKEDVIYKKLLMVLRSQLDEEDEYFPELTKKQAKEWVLHLCTNNYVDVLLSAFVSIMTNHSLRLCVFGV